MMTLKEAAEQIGAPYRTIQRAAKTGALESVRINSRVIRVSEQALANFVDRKTKTRRR